MADSNNPLLDGHDIQGNIFPGFRRQAQLLVGYRAPTENALRAALAVLAPHITPLLLVLRHRDGRKAALSVGDPAPQMQDLWVNLALGAGALDRLAESGVRNLDDGFEVGMRPARTGDPWSAKDAQGRPNPAHPSNWKVGRPSEPLDVLVILAFDDWTLARGDAFLSELSNAGIQEIYREPGVRLENDSEHFGFADGISELGIRGVVEDSGEERPLTTRYGVSPQDGLEFGKPGQVLVWPGQFLVGTPTGPNQTDPAPPSYRNGSFLVFRRLSQNVRAFDQDTAQMAESVSATGEAISPQQLRAKIVGRWPSGAAIMRHAQDPGFADGILAANYFRFGEASPDLQLAEGAVAGAVGDPAPSRGVRCPAFAHIRKVNPRDLPTDKGDEALTRSFQMLRRGIPFGPAYDRTTPNNPVNSEPRGLLFLAYQRSISGQFEKLNSDWMNTDKGPGPGGFDLFIGQRVASDSGQYANKTATLYDAPAPVPGRNLSAPSTWVQPSGGAYLFAPSLSHIRKLATIPLAILASDVRAATLPLRATSLPEMAEYSHEDIPRHDGETRTRRRGGQDVLVEARWPLKALLESTAPALSGAALGTLDLSGEHFPTGLLTAPEAVSLAQDSELHDLYLDGVTLGGATVTALVRQLDGIRFLNLAGCDLDDADVATLAQVQPAISSITVGLASPREGHRFTAPRLTSEVLRSLGGFKTLRNVGLRGVKISDADVAASDLWDRLETIDLGETYAGDAAAHRLALAPFLRSVKMDQTLVRDDGAKVLLGRPLEGVSFARTAVSQAGLVSGTECRNLRHLDLAGTALDDNFADALRRFPAIETLDLSDTHIGDRTAEALAAIPALRRLNVASTKISAAGIAHLASSFAAHLNLRGLFTDPRLIIRLAAAPQLRHLALSVDDWTGLSEIRSDLDLEAPATNENGLPPRLSRLLLRGHCTPALAQNLTRAAHLESLTVIGSMAGIRFESGFASLRNFRAEETTLDNQSVAGLLKAPRLEALYISGNPFGEVMNAVTGDYLHTLELRGTTVGDQAIEAIRRLPRLHCLDLPFTKVSAGGIARLALHAGNLQSLALDASQVDDVSVRALAGHNRLLEIYLYGPEVDRTTLKMLSPVRIRDLSLIDTGITDESIPVIAAMPRLRTLRLGSELSKDGLTSLRALRPDLAVDAQIELGPLKPGR